VVEAVVAKLATTVAPAALNREQPVHQILEVVVVVELILAQVYQALADLES
jgi:hypothetical protein